MNMKKYVWVVMLLCLQVDAVSNAGLKHRASDKAKAILQGIGILGHLGFNAMFAYFQTEQNKFLAKISYPDNEVGVAEEDKKCGSLCQENSRFIRNNVYRSEDLNGFATTTSVLSGLSNLIALCIWSAKMHHWEQRTSYAPNVNRFVNLALGLSVLNAFFDLGTTSLTVEVAAHHLSDIPLRTLAPWQVAAMNGAGYWLPMILFGGYGMAKGVEFLKGAYDAVNLNWISLREPAHQP